MSGCITFFKFVPKMGDTVGVLYEPPSYFQFQMKFASFPPVFCLTKIIVLFLLICATSNGTNDGTGSDEDSARKVQHLFDNAIKPFLKQFAQTAFTRGRDQLYLTYADVAHIVWEVEENVAKKFIGKGPGEEIQIG